MANDTLASGHMRPAEHDGFHGPKHVLWAMETEDGHPPNGL